VPVFRLPLLQSTISKIKLFTYSRYKSQYDHHIDQINTFLSLIKYSSHLECNNFCWHIQITFLKDLIVLIHSEYRMKYRYARKKSDSKARVFILIMEDNSKNSSEVAYRKELYSLHMVNINFNLIIFKICGNIGEREGCLLSYIRNKTYRWNFQHKFNYYMQHIINKFSFMKMNTTDHRY